MTTNFTTGLTNKLSTDVTGSMILPDPFTMHSYSEDFDYYDSNQWTGQQLPGALLAATNEKYGVLSISSSVGGIGNYGSIIKKFRTFIPEANKKLYFEARFKVSDIINGNILIGLTDQQGNPFTVNDGIYFYGVPSAAGINIAYVVNGVSITKSVIANPANDVYLSVGFSFDGVNKIKYQAKADNDTSTIYGEFIVSSTLTTVLLAPKIAIQDDNAVNNVARVDYILAAQER